MSHCTSICRQQVLLLCVLFDDSLRFFFTSWGGGGVNIRSVFEQYTGCFLFFLLLIFVFS